MAENPYTLTVTDLFHLADLAGAVGSKSNVRARWAVDGDMNTVADGVIRNFTKENGMFWTDKDGDVRDAFLWISGMFESFIPVRTVLAQMVDGTFYVENGK